MKDKCSFCGIDKLITFHHLIPKSLHSNKWFKKNFAMKDMQQRGIYICRKCHYFIHDQFSEKELGRRFNTLEELLQNEVIQKHIHWAKKQY